MGFMRPPGRGPDTVRQRLDPEPVVRFDHRPFPLPPLGLQGIQPGAFTRQPTGDAAHATPGLFDPGGRASAALSVPPGSGATRPCPTPAAHPMPGSWAWPAPAAHRRPTLGACVCHQGQRLRVRGPGVQGGRRQATPPDRSATAERPCGLDRRQTPQAVARGFSGVRWVGTGAPARGASPPDAKPSAREPTRRAGPCRGSRPSASATSAAKGVVQRRVGWPKSRGRWCRSSRNCARRVVLNTAWGV